MKITEYTRERAEVLNRMDFSNPNISQIGILWFDAVNTAALRQRIAARVHSHSFDEIHLILAGTCTYDCMGRQIALSAGQALLLPRKMPTGILTSAKTF